MKFRKLSILVFTIFIALVTKQSFGGVIHYEFIQEGWVDTYDVSGFPIAENGIVTGFFSGEDSNSDGELEFFELLSYGMSFSGNTKVGAFTHGLNDLQLFNYTLGSIGFSPFGLASWPLYSNNGIFLYDADDGVIRDISSGISFEHSTGTMKHTAEDRVRTSALVTKVPEPNLIEMFGLACLMVLYRKTNKKL